MRWTVKPYQTGEQKWVTAYYLGYFWDWTLPASAAIDAVDMTTMTHFVFARYAPGSGTSGGTAGQLVPAAGTGHTAVEDPLISKAHAAGVKAIMMIGGANDGNGFVASTVDAQMRATFIGNILDKCEEKFYDGVDMDWEEQLNNATQRNQLKALLSELRAAAASRERWQAPNPAFVITFPGGALNVNIDTVQTWKVEVAALVDQYNLMSYNMHYDDVYGWTTWFFAALDDGGPGSHPMAIKQSIDKYYQAGVPRAKLGMGLGLYGGGYAPPITGMRQGGPFSMWGNDDDVDMWSKFYRGGSSGFPGVNMFEHPNGTYVWDEAAQTGYYRYSPAIQYKGYSSQAAQNVAILTCEDLQSIAAKGAWAKAGNCGGTIVWAYNYGMVTIDGVKRNPPMEKIRDSFLR